MAAAGGIFQILMPIALFAWAVLDLANPPSEPKALAKIMVGVAAVLIPTPLTVFAAPAIITALLGVADLAAVRGRKEED